MRNKVLAAFISLALPVVGFAATSDNDSAPLRIAVVDVKSVVQKSAELNKINTDLTNTFKPREQKIVSAQSTLKTDEDKLQKDGPVMSESERNQLQDKIISERANLQGLITSFQQDLDNAQNSNMQKLLSKISSIVDQIAKRDHYDLVLQGDSVPYVVDRLNITNEVLQELNKK